MRKKLLPVLGAALVTAGVCAGGASAADYCVADADCVAGGGTSVAGVQQALDAAKATPVADRVLIGPGTFEAPTVNGFRFTPATTAVEIRGAGLGKTILTAPSGASRVLFMTSTAATSVTDLTAALPPNFAQGGSALDLNGAAMRVAVTTDPTQSLPFTGVHMRAGSFEDGSIQVPANLASQGMVISGPNVIVRRSTVSGRRGINVGSGAPNALIDRATVRSNGSTGVSSASPNARFKNGVVESKSLSFDSALMAFAGGGTDADLHAENATIVGDGPNAQGAYVALGGDGINARITIDNSVMRGFTRSLYANDGQTGTATIETTHSDYNPAGNMSSGGATLVQNSASFNGANAGFRDAAAGDYRLRHDSPLVDSGDNALVDSGELDLAGNPLIADGDGAGGPERDQGAYEYQRAVPVAAIKAPAGGAQGEELSFSGAGSTDANDEALTYSWSFGDGATATGPEVKHAYTTAGARTVTLTVTDPTGEKSTATANLQIAASDPVKPVEPADPVDPVDPPRPPLEQDPTEPQNPPAVDTRAPALTSLRLAPARFATRRVTGSSVRYGTRLSFRLDETASVRVTIKRARAKRSSGTIRVHGEAGLNRAEFTGRIGKRRLAAGRYTATLVATDGAGNKSAPRAVKFRVVR